MPPYRTKLIKFLTECKDELCAVIGEDEFKNSTISVKDVVKKKKKAFYKVTFKLT